jgi:hypothetical protein
MNQHNFPLIWKIFLKINYQRTPEINGDGTERFHYGLDVILWMNNAGTSAKPHKHPDG